MTTLPHDDLGAGAPLVLLHGYPFDARLWDPQRAALAQKYRVITPDLAGFGRAGGLSPRTSIDAHAADVLALLDALDLPKVTLVGLSMGGYIALAFVRRYASRLRGLVLADTRAAADSPEARAGRATALALVEREGVGPVIDGLIPRLLSAAAPAEVKDRVRKIALDQRPAGLIVALGAMRDRPDATSVLPEVAVPSLLIFGAEDVISPRAEAEQMAKAMPGSELAVLEGAGHLSNLEAPEAFNAALLAWLKRTAE